VRLNETRCTRAQRKGGKRTQGTLTRTAGNNADRSAPKSMIRSLDHVIGVRIPASQPSACARLRMAAPALGELRRMAHRHDEIPPKRGARRRTNPCLPARLPGLCHSKRETLFRGLDLGPQERLGKGFLGKNMMKSPVMEVLSLTERCGRASRVGVERRAPEARRTRRSFWLDRAQLSLSASLPPWKTQVSAVRPR